MNFDQFYTIFSKGIITPTLNSYERAMIPRQIRDIYDTLGRRDMTEAYVQTLKVAYIIGRKSGLEARLSRVTSKKRD